MRIVKYLLLLFTLFVIAFVVFVATQPNTYNVVKRMEIKSNYKNIVNFVKDFNNFEIWQSFENDEDTKFIYSSKTDTETAFTSWNKNYKLATIFIGKDSIAHNYENGNANQILQWKFLPQKNKTLVTVNIKGDLSFKQKIFSVLYGGVSNYAGDEIEKGLKKIENYLVNELGTYTVSVKGFVLRQKNYYLALKDSSARKDIPKKLPVLTKKILDFTKSNGIPTYGKPFVIFYNNPLSNNLKYCVAIYTNNQILLPTESDIFCEMYATFSGTRTVLKGDYAYFNQAITQSRKYILENKKTEDFAGMYFANYNITPKENKQPSMWETEIFVPIVRKIATPRVKISRDSTNTQNNAVPSNNEETPPNVFE
jgi:effector-binding domain-containing protein